MKKRILYISTGVTLLSGSVFSAGLFDNFDSYADQTAFNASWNATDAAGARLNLKTSGGYSGSNYLSHDTTSNMRSSKAIDLTASDSAPVVASFWTRVSNTDKGGRSYLQIEANGSNFVTLGAYNNPDPLVGWGGRAFSAGAGNWTAIGGTRYDVVEGVNQFNWRHMKVVIKEKEVTFFQNDTQIGTSITPTNAWPKFVTLRIGFSLGTATPVAVDYDDVNIQNAPSGVTDWNVY